MHIGLLLIHVAVGLLVAAHGSQKLFGWYGGGGLQGTSRHFEALGLVPGRAMAVAAGSCELVGGLLLAAGFITPVAAALVAATMLVAARTQHAGKGPWIAAGGWEYALTVATVAIGLAFNGAGAWSLDAAVGWDLSGLGWGAGAIAVALAGGVGVLAAVRTRRAPVAGARPGAQSLTRAT
jgi:putative oxidoreductase